MNTTRRECLRLGLAAGAAVLAPMPTLATEARMPLQIGLWGCHARGLALGVSALRCTSAVELRVIADPDPARAARAANWWRHPAHRDTLRKSVRLGDAGVLSGPTAADTLAALPLDALLVADDGAAPPEALLHRNACVLAPTVSPALLSCLRLARLRALAGGSVVSVCTASRRTSHACSGATSREQTLVAFFDAIRHGRSGDVDGQVAALLAAGSTASG